MARRRWMRFSVATLLFVVFCFAGFFAGYLAGISFRQADYIMDVRLYSIADLLTHTDEERRMRQVRGIIADITGTINPTNWEEVGGEGFIVPMGGTEEPLAAPETLKVVALRKDQRQIQGLLAELRRQRESEGEAYRPREIKEYKLTPVGGTGTF